MAGGCMCAICYEDVDPASELLQSIALCGHVFHELCLQQWIEFCPNGRSPTCPLCKQTCGVKDVHRLYFQSDSSKDATDQSIQKNSSDLTLSVEDKVRLDRLTAKVTMLTLECRASREKLLRSESEGQRHLEQLTVLEAEKTKWRKDKGLLAQTLARNQEELRVTLKHREELLERTEAMAKEVAAYRLATDVSLSEVDMARLISPGNRFASKDDTIEMLTKALFVKNRAFKGLMHKCQEMGMGESRAELKSQKLMEQVKRMKAKMYEMTKVEEEKENAKVRSLTRTKLFADTTRGSQLSLNDGHSAQLAKASETTPLLSHIHPKAKKVGVSTGAASLPLAPVPLNVICLDDDSGASEAHARSTEPGCVARFSEILPASQRFDEEFTLRKRSDSGLGQPHCAAIYTSEPIFQQSLGRQPQEDFALRTMLGQCTYEGKSRQGAGSSWPEGKPKMTIGLDGDIDNVAALRRVPMLPIRQELGLGQGATSFTRPQSATGFQMPATTEHAVTPSASKFILSGADGRGGRVRVLKPPRHPGVGSSSNVLGVMRANRFKPPIAWAKSSALKIEHFFGRG